MASTVKLSNEVIERAKRYADVYHRSIPKQIEYWFNVGKLAEENPDLPYNFIKDIILAMEEYKHEDISEYSFGTNNAS